MLLQRVYVRHSRTSGHVTWRNVSASVPETEQTSTECVARLMFTKLGRVPKKEIYFRQTSLLSQSYCRLDQCSTSTKVIWYKAESLSFYSPGSGSNLQLRVLAGVFPQLSPFPGGQGPHSTQCVTGPHKCTYQVTSKSIERFKQSARMWQTTDRQTTLQRNV